MERRRLLPRWYRSSEDPVVGDKMDTLGPLVCLVPQAAAVVEPFSSRPQLALRWPAPFKPMAAGVELLPTLRF